MYYISFYTVYQDALLGLTVFTYPAKLSMNMSIESPAGTQSPFCKDIDNKSTMKITITFCIRCMSFLTFVVVLISFSVTFLCQFPPGTMVS